ncbi:MAG: TonB-dependent receptor domain-containing protein [Blastocatellia bacterium]
MNPYRHLHQISLFVFLCLALTTAFAQQLATLNGTVTDLSAASVPNATIKLVNDQTGESYTAVTSESGSYTIPLIKPGDYTLTVEARGFKVARHTGIILETGTPARVDVTLEVGAVTDVVNIAATAPILQTENASVGTVIRNESIVNLPLVGRRAAQLARLSGFVVQQGTGSRFAMAGGRGDNSNWMIDGGNAQNVLLGVATLSFDPPIDALQEFSVEISNYKAELGRTGGGVVQMTTKSGTNRFHGTASEFLRNDALDARNFFAAVKPVLRYNQFGGSIGGPIKRDKTFFFFNYEGIRRKTQNTRIVSVPSQAEINGDFSATNITPLDPLTGQAFPNKRIPANRIDPVGQAIAKFFPVANVPGAANRTNNFRANQSVVNPNNNYVARIDHTISANDRIYGRFLHSDGFSDEAPIYPTPGTDNFHLRSNNGYYSWAVTWFHNFSPTTILETRFSWDRRKFENLSGGRGTGLNGKIGLKGVDPDFFAQVMLTGLPTFGVGQHERLQNPIRGDQGVASVTMLRGRHTFKFGGEYRLSKNLDNVRNSAGGNFGFTNNFTGDSLVSLLLGHVNSASRVENLTLDTRAATIGGYAQTDWKVNNKLTLNLGLRYDLDFPRWEINNRQNSFDINATNPACNCPGLIVWSGRNGLSKYAHNFDKNNFGPRVGFAYRLTDKTVVRGGGAMVYIGAYDQATPTQFAAGFSIQGNFTSPDGGRTPALKLSDGLPNIPVPSDANLIPGFGAVAIGQNPVLAVDFLEPTNRPTPYLQTFNLNVQRELPWNMVVEVGYLGTLGHKLGFPGSHSINQVPPDKITTGNVQRLRPFPQFTNVTIHSQTIGNSNYHGMNIKFEKRMSAGLQFTTNYTWSKAIDDVTSRNEIGGSGAFQNQYDRQSDRGLSGNHIAHRFINSTVWDLPFGKGKKVNIENGVLNQIAGGWTVGLIVELRTGVPFTASENNAAAVYPTAASVRSNLAGTYSLNPNWRSNVLGEPYFNTSVFAAPAFGKFGNLGRNVFIGPGAVIADLSILKDFRIREGHFLQFRTEMLNFPNHPNFGLPNQGRGNPAFGRISGLIDGNQARIIQFGLHYRF